jgi:hypothetical protein
MKMDLKQHVESMEIHIVSKWSFLVNDECILVD